ncbi:MAG TPA: DedA family protein [Thermoanaerobaculia bacterium]|nr:DedA family protein [Thermoanaerobaculia bacterium]
MGFARHLVDIFLHLDSYLGNVLREYGGWTYLLLFVIVFCETGLVVTPILPGDSLLFAAGAFAGLGALSAGWLIAVFLAAAVLGNTVNYWVGRLLGTRLVEGGKRKLIKPEHLERTHRFYESYGGKTLVLTRFVPILRTIAPFVAGLGRMSFARFTAYNVAGGALWVVVGVVSGLLFGNVPVVKKNFSLVILAIVAVSLVPAAVELVRARRSGRLRGAEPPAAGGELNDRSARF